jgi:hypothetical protein
VVSFAIEGTVTASERFAAHLFDPARVVEETTARRGSFPFRRHDRHVGRSLRIHSPDNSCARGVRENVFPRIVSGNVPAVPEERSAVFGAAADPEPRLAAARDDG